MFEDNKDNLRKNANYYLLWAEVWEFFLSIYGGGPTIIVNDYNETGPKAMQSSLQVQSKNETRDSAFMSMSIRTQSTAAFTSNNFGSSLKANNELAGSKFANGSEDGVVGLKNNSMYCYLNACMQCLAPIDQLKQHYEAQTYA